METITKKVLIDRLAERHGMTQSEVKKLLQDFLDELSNEMIAGNRIEFRDFGVFEVREQAPRRAHNPRTLEQFDIPRRLTVKFKPSQKLKQQFERADPAVVEVKSEAGRASRSRA